jgi:hypothetical protein
VKLPQGGTKTDEFRKINPLEKIPTLDDDGFFLPESSAIGEYLEDTRPTPSLRPADPKLRARMRVVYNIADQYVMTPLYDLFDHIDPSKRQQAVVDEKLVELNKALGDLSHFLDDGKYANGGTNSMSTVRATEMLTDWAKTNYGVVIFIGQVTKSGDFAGKQTILHAVDVRGQLYIDNEKKSETYGERIFEITKNRFGCSGKSYVLGIQKTGLYEKGSFGG